MSALATPTPLAAINRPPESTVNQTTATESSSETLLSPAPPSPSSHPIWWNFRKSERWQRFWKRLVWTMKAASALTFGICGILWAVKSYKAAVMANELSRKESCRTHPNNPFLQSTLLCQEMRQKDDFDYATNISRRRDDEFPFDVDFFSDTDLWFFDRVPHHHPHRHFPGASISLGGWLVDS